MSLKFDSFHPLNNQVLLEPIKEERVTESGIILVDKFRDRQIIQHGFVVERAPATYLSTGATAPCLVDFGDLVLYDRSKALDLEVGGIECVLVHEDAIIVKVIEDE